MPSSSSANKKSPKRRAPRRHPMRPPQFRLRRGRGSSGLGLFALEDIPKKRFIVEYVGPLIDDDAADHAGGRYVFGLDNGWNIDGSSRRNLARYANHGCHPNAESHQVGNRIFIFSTRRIPAGAEIAFDYGKAYYDSYVKPIGCKCGAKKHRK